MGFMPAKALPTPPGHYQTREQTALFKVLSKFMHEENAVIIRRFWWLCPDGNCTSQQLNDEIHRLRKLGQKINSDIQGLPKKRIPRKPVITEREIRGMLR